MRYQQICPVSLASEVIAERWTPLILREIVLFNQTHFSEIQRGVGRISQSLLAERLRTLEAAGIVERRPNRAGRGWTYHPTEAGRELETVLNELGIWAQHWIELRREHCDPPYLMTTVHSLLQVDRLPERTLDRPLRIHRHPAGLLARPRRRGLGVVLQRSRAGAGPRRNAR